MLKSKVFTRESRIEFAAPKAQNIWIKEHLTPFIIPKKAMNLQVVYTVKETNGSVDPDEIIFGLPSDFKSGSRITTEKYCHIVWW